MEELRHILMSVSPGYYKRLKPSRRTHVRKEEFRSYVEDTSPKRLARILRTVAVLRQMKVYLTLVNLALQQPSTIFNNSQIYHVQQGHDKRMGSLDLLKSNSILIQQRMTSEDIDATHKTMELSKKV